MLVKFEQSERKHHVEEVQSYDTDEHLRVLPVPVTYFRNYIGHASLATERSMRSSSTFWKFALTPLIILGVGLSQSSHKSRSVVVNGHTGEAVIYQIDGKSFMDLESLVRIGNGSMSFRGEQIVLTFQTVDNAHDSGRVSTAVATETPHSNNPGLTPDFMRAAVQTISALKDWTDKLAFAAQRGVPGDGSRVVLFHDRAAEALRLTKVAAASDSDQNALTLLTNHFNTVSGWSDKLVGERRSMDTGKYSMSEDAFRGDATYQKISNCNKFLSSMLPSGQFHDDGSCR
jgi:hypothetical protein